MKKRETWTPYQLAVFLKANPEAKIRFDYARLREMYPEVDLPNSKQETNDG